MLAQHVLLPVEQSVAPASLCCVFFKGMCLNCQGLIHTDGMGWDGMRWDELTGLGSVDLARLSWSRWSSWAGQNSQS